MDVRLTWTDCDDAGEYIVPNVLRPRDLVSRPDNMDQIVLHIDKKYQILKTANKVIFFQYCSIAKIRNLYHVNMCSLPIHNMSKLLARQS